MSSPEAALLKQANALKESLGQNDPESMLTAAQVDVLETIRQHRADGEPFINLYGPRGSGKTFLCWVLHATDEWEYHQALPDSIDSPAVIYDHGESDRTATRRLRNHATINAVASVVYVTEQPAQEVFPRVKLDPSEDHYETIAQQWTDLNLSPKQAPKL
jgi:hypothetical protein